MSTPKRKTMTNRQISYALDRLNSIYNQKLVDATIDVGDEPEVPDIDFTTLVDAILNGSKKITASTFRSAINSLAEKGKLESYHHREPYYRETDFIKILSEMVFSKELAEYNQAEDEYLKRVMDANAIYNDRKDELFAEYKKIEEQIVLGDQEEALVMIQQFAEKHND